MSYCDYNPTLFKEFTSMKTKVKPALSTSWKLSAVSYSKNESCILKNDEGVSIADISISRLLDFMKQENITMIGDSLQGNYIIGNDRSLYTEEMYNTWREKFQLRISTEIPKKELIEGHLYKTVCGSTLLFLGKRYILNISREYTLTKGSWEYMCVPYFNQECRNIQIAKINQKVIEDLGLYAGYEKMGSWELKNQEDIGSSLPYPIYYGKEALDIKDAELHFIPVEDSFETYDWKLPFTLYMGGISRIAKSRAYGNYRTSEYYISNNSLSIDLETRRVSNWNNPQPNSMRLDDKDFKSKYKRGFVTLVKKSKDNL